MDSQFSNTPMIHINKGTTTPYQTEKQDKVKWKNKHCYWESRQC